jgi:hypothetical protein
MGEFRCKVLREGVPIVDGDGASEGTRRSGAKNRPVPGHGVLPAIEMELDVEEIRPGTTEGLQIQ